jgi:hypothetical protein
MPDAGTPSSQSHPDVTITDAGPLPVSGEALARGHEQERIGLRGYVIFVVALIVSAIVIHLILWLTMCGFEKAVSHNQGLERNSALQPERPTSPPGPILQPSPAQGEIPRQPWQDMAAYRVHEQELLSTYGYDPKSGQVRIPIDRAMELLVQRGLPTTQPSMRLPGATTRQMNPESSGGR